MYEQQDGDTQKNLARNYYKTAAISGHPKAQYHYACSLYKQQNDLSLQWFKKSAAQEHLESQLILGKYYANNKDTKKATVWYTKATKQNNPEAHYLLGLLAAQNLRFKDAHSHYQDAADQRHVGAWYKLGIIYSLGQGIPIDQQKALEYFKQAADGQHAKAQYNLARHYLKNREHKDDFAKGVRWLKKAADQGITEACFTLGLLCDTRLCADLFPDQEKAAEEYLQKAAEKGNQRAETQLDNKRYLNAITQQLSGARFKETLETTGISSDDEGKNPDLGFPTHPLIKHSS